MTDYSVHEPDYSGTTEDDWNALRENDFDAGDPGEIAGPFVLSASGFDDSDRYSDLNAPVVDPDGNLNANTLRTAYSGGHSVEKVDDIDDDTVTDARDVLDDLADEFDDLNPEE